MDKKKILILILSFCIINFILLAILMETNNINWLDYNVYNSISKSINSHNTTIMKSITTLGSAYILIPFMMLIILFIWLNKKYFLYGKMLLFTLISSDVINVCLKSIFLRIRPNILPLVKESGYSFPSAHALVSLCFYGYIIYVISTTVKSKWKYVINTLLVLIIIGIGFSRIYLGVHYLSDVISGFCIGFIWLFLMIYLTERQIKK